MDIQNELWVGVLFIVAITVLHLYLQKVLIDKWAPRLDLILMSVLIGGGVFLTSFASPFVAVVLFALCWFAYVASTLNARFFDELIPLFQVKLFLTSSQTRKNNVNLLGTAAKSLLRPADLLFPVSLILVVSVGLIFPVQAQAVPLGVLGGVWLVVLLLVVLRFKAVSKQASPLHLFERFSLIGYYLASDHDSNTGDLQADLQALSANKRKASSEGQDPLFGIYKGKNVLFIQLESFQGFVVDCVVDGQEVTPFLNKLAREGMHFDEVFAQYAMGHTADCELVTLNSLYPLKKEIVNYNHFDKTFQSLPKMLKPFGYSATSYHNYSGEYYNRKMMHQTYGFEHYYAIDEYRMDHKIGLGLSDLSFLQQTVHKLKAQKKPFFGHIITLTSHYPFTIEESEHRLKITSDLDPMIQQYFQTVRHTDYALEQFFAAMQQEGLLEDTVVVFFGDHEGVPMAQRDELVRFLNLDESVLKFHAVNLRKVPFVIYAGEKCPQKPMKSSQVGSNLDVLPTVMHLLGMEKSEYQFGESLLHQNDNRLFALRPYFEGSFVSEDYLFAANPGGEFEKGNLFNRKTGELLDLSAHPDVLKMHEEIAMTLSVSDRLIRNNLIPELEYQEVDIVERYNLLPPALRDGLELTEEDSILLPFPYSSNNSHKRSVESNGHYYESIWQEFAAEKRRELSFFFQIEHEVNKKPIYFADCKYIPIFGKNGYKTEVVKGTTLFERMDQLEDDTLIFLSVRDDGSQAFRDGWEKQAANYGIHLTRNDLRKSYLNILVKKDQKFVSLLEQCEEGKLEVTLAAGEMLHGVEVPVPVHLVSGGFKAGNLSQIEIDGAELSPSKRGMNIVFYNLRTQQVVEAFNLDSYLTVHLDDAMYVAKKMEPRELAVSKSKASFKLPAPIEANQHLIGKHSIILPFTLWMDNSRKEKVQANGNEHQAYWESYEKENEIALRHLFEIDHATNGKKIHFADNKFVHHMRSHQYKVEVLAGSTLFEVLNKVEPGHLILISVKDDGSQAFKDEAQRVAKGYGIKLNRQHLRHSYVNLMIKKPNRTLSLQEQISLESIEVLVEKGSQVGEVECPVEIRIQSAGSKSGNKSSILIDGQEHSKNKRGLNIVVYNPATNEVVDSFNIDSFVDLQAADTLYVAIPTPKQVVDARAEVAAASE